MKHNAYPMASNYYVKSGYAENWLNNTIEKQLNLQLTGSEETVTVEISGQPEYFDYDGGRRYFNIPRKLCAAALAQLLNGTERTGANNNVYVISASCEGAGYLCQL